MDFIVLLILGVLATIIILPIVAIVRANSFARSLREEMAEVMDRIRDLERRLLKLATELNDEVARQNRSALNSEQMKKLAEIEKLARNVKEKMTQSVPDMPANQSPMNPTLPPSFPQRP